MRPVRLHKVHRGAQRGPDEYLEGHQGADRVARQCDDRRSPGGSSRTLWHTGLHCDFDELDASVGSGAAAQCVLDHLVGTGADTA